MSQPSRTQIKSRVIHNLAIISGFSEAKIREDWKLDQDLGLGIHVRGNLAPGFQVIAKESNHSAQFTKTECKKIKDVKECIDLVHKRSKPEGT